jgi:hypothetical protein
MKIKAPKITAAERESLTKYKGPLEAAIKDVEAECQCVIDLRKKERKFQKESDSLKRHAANFHRDSEIQLAATLKQIARVNEAIAEAEGRAYEAKRPLYIALDSAQAAVSKICQATYEELLDMQAAALAPFWGTVHDAREIGKTSVAVNHLTRTLLRHCVGEYDSIELLDQTARDVLRKVEALLSGSVIWEFEGAEVPAAAAWRPGLKR